MFYYNRSYSHLNKMLFQWLKLRNYSSLAIPHSNICSSSLSMQSESFDDMVARRRVQAQKSVIVRMPNDSLSTTQNLVEDCLKAGSISRMMSYNSSSEKMRTTSPMLLIEYEDKKSVDNLVLSGANVRQSAMPIRSPFLSWDSTSSKCDGRKFSEAKEICGLTIERPQTLTDKSLYQKLVSCSSISDQMLTFHHHRKSTELDVRLSFLTCRQMELAMTGLFPLMNVLPFGSSVNGFGHSNSDLDMIINLNPDQIGDQHTGRSSNLYFENKNSDLLNNRALSQNFLELLGDLLYNVMPGCQKVYKILRARVPIVKYKQELTNLECDLTVDNRSGLYMSALLYQYSVLDARVAPLLFTVRQFARELTLTSTQPGKWISNFSLAMMVLYFLINKKILPPVNLLKQYARPEDLRIAEGNVECHFLRDIEKLRQLHTIPQTEKELPLAYLLLEFFEFYDEFDLKRRGFSLVSGSDFIKPIQCAMYIENPLDAELNVTRNLSLEELDRISETFKAARKQMEKNLADGDKGVEYQDSANWGVLSLWSRTDLSSLSKKHPDFAELLTVGKKDIVKTASQHDSNIMPNNFNAKTIKNYNKTQGNSKQSIVIKEHNNYKLNGSNGRNKSQWKKIKNKPVFKW